MTRDLRTLIYLLNLKLREECSRTLGPDMGWNPVCNRVSSSSSGCNRGAAVEADVIGRRAAAEAGAIGEQQLDARWRQTGSSSGSGYRNRAWEQQLKRTQSGRSKADAIGEKQLFRELLGIGLRTVGEQGGSS